MKTQNPILGERTCDLAPRESRRRCIKAAILGRSALAAALALLLTTAPARADLAFNFTMADGTPQEAMDGIAAAAALWSAVFDDDITVNIDASFASWGVESGWLGEAFSYNQTLYSYADARAALVADATSADDVSSSSSLQSGDSAALLINRTADNPDGPGSATPYLDDNGGDNNSVVRMGSANAKALGLIAGDGTASDGSITFNSDMKFDYDRSDGIAADSFDFLAVALHEIGHVLGFFSGVDALDGSLPPNDPNGPYKADLGVFVMPLDLFRFSAESREYGVGVFDWTADDREKYFSVDGGTTSAGATFSNGIYLGDGRQASHWKDGLGYGVMTPAFGTGETSSITINDIRAFDVIGYDLRASAAVPEPATFAMLGVGTLGALSLAVRRRNA